MRARHAAIGLLFALLAACAVTNRPQIAPEPFCRVGDLTFHTDFEGAALHACAPDFVFDAFCTQRLGADRNGLLYGDMAEGVDQTRLIERAMPAV